MIPANILSECLSFLSRYYAQQAHVSSPATPIFPPLPLFTLFHHGAALVPSEISHPFHWDQHASMLLAKRARMVLELFSIALAESSHILDKYENGL